MLRDLSGRHVAVAVATNVFIDGSPFETRTLFDWCADNPAAITATFANVDGTAETWTWSRKLLAEGARARLFTGQGDVQVRGPGSVISIRLTNGADPAAFFLFLRGPVDEFIRRCEREMPSGSAEETAVIEAAIDNFLEGMHA